MHENVIIEGNTIYELDPDCVRERNKKRHKRGNHSHGGDEEGKCGCGEEDNRRRKDTSMNSGYRRGYNSKRKNEIR